MPEMGDESEANRILLENTTYGLAALKALLDTIDAIVDAILEDTGTTLDANITTLLTRLSALRAGYLDNINNAELALLARWQRSQQIIFNSGADTTPAGATEYISCLKQVAAHQASTPTEWYYYCVWPITRAGTLKNLVCTADAVAGAGESFVYTVRKNAVDTALTVTISGDTELTDSDETNTVTVAVGDYITLQIVTSAGAAAVRHTAAFEFEG